MLPALLTLCSFAQQRPAITGLAHASFYADDLQASQHFYESVMGWIPVPEQGGMRFYANHAQYVELLPPPVRGQQNRFASVAFATSDAEGLLRFLAAKGIAVPKSVTVEKDGARSFRVHDPEGNLIEFTQNGKGVAAPSAQQLARRLSPHILHAGYVVRDRAKLDHFYRDALGFHLYWQGGAKPGDIDWVMMQVPDGADWIEYMLYLLPKPTRAALGSANHIAPGVTSVAELQKHLEQDGWKAPVGKDPKVLGVDGKLQLDLSDPDGTRVEFMGLKPVKTPCCSAYMGRQPVASDAW